MKFFYSDSLIEYMNKVNKFTIVIEVVICNNSEIEIADLHVYLIDEIKAKFFKEVRGYGFVNTEYGQVLIPKFKLHFDENIYFDLKKIICFNFLKYKGIILEK